METCQRLLDINIKLPFIDKSYSVEYNENEFLLA